MKVLAIIQARLGSSRLPSKVLMPIEGTPILVHIINSLKLSKFINQIIVATTTSPKDDKIVDLCKEIDLDYYRGSEKDVLDRYYECAKFFKGDLIIRITGDNPLLDPTLIDELIQISKKTSCDYASNVLHQSYPVGYSPCEILTFSTLQKLHENEKEPLSREHVTYQIRNNPSLYKIEEIIAPAHLSRPKWRLTVDYEEDLELISKIFEKLYQPKSFIQYSKLVEFLDKNKELLKINEAHN